MQCDDDAWRQPALFTIVTRLAADTAQIGVASFVVVVMRIVPAARKIDIDTSGVWFVVGFAVGTSKASEV